uniref:RUN domain-containing protein n=1 Tax=Hippocampus comes TaxID=109280 RepID=A0A3Q3D4A6_HIPCM
MISDFWFLATTFGTRQVQNSNKAKMSVSRAVDLIIAHFGNSRDPEEKMRLGNSYLSAMMASLVLDHLCPAIQNILEDGLRDHKLDIVVGQRRNSSWTVVEVSTKPGNLKRSAVLPH